MANKQDEILAKISALKSTNSIPPFDSRDRRFNNQSGGFIDFLFNLVKQTSGQEKFKNIVFKSVLGELNQSTEINNLIRDVFKENYFCDFDFRIPQKYTTESVNGIELDIDSIDISGLLNIDPESEVGRNVYEGNDINQHMNYFIYKSQFVDNSNPLTFNGENGVLFELSSNTNNTLNFKFGSFYKNKPFSLWSEDFFNSTEFFNSSNFTTNLINSLFGSLFVKTNTSSNEASAIERVESALAKTFGFCDEEDLSNPNATSTEDSSVDISGAEFLRARENRTNTTGGDNIFNFTSQELTDIENEVNRKTKGQFIFNTCDDLPLTFDADIVFNNLNSLFSDRGGASYNNNNVNINIDDATNFFDGVLKEGAKQAIDEGEGDIRINFSNMLNEIQSSIIKSIPHILINTVLSPKTMMFIAVANKIVADEDSDSSETLIDSISGTLGVIGSEAANTVLQNITRFLLKELGKLARDLAVNFLRQRALDYANIFLVFANLLNIGNIDLDSCGGIINTILTLLSGNITTPAPTVPHIVIPVLNSVKPGLNQVSIVNDYKAKLQEKGIETAPFYADGTPNYQMYMMEELINVMTQHIKFNSKIDVGGFAGPFPIVGGGQII